MDEVVYYGSNLCCRTLRCDIFILAAAQRSRNIQLRKMLQKYFINNMPQEFLAGGIQLKKIRVQKDRLVVYYKRFRADDYKEL